MTCLVLRSQAYPPGQVHTGSQLNGSWASANNKKIYGISSVTLVISYMTNATLEMS